MSADFHHSDEQDHSEPSEELNPPDSEAFELSEEVYARIVEQVQQIQNSLAAASGAQPPASSDGKINRADHSHSRVSELNRIVDLPVEIPVPREPNRLEEAGVSLLSLTELTLKFLYLSGNATCQSISQQLKLPVPLVAEGLRSLLLADDLELESGESAELSTIRYQLTESGRNRARDVFKQCRYVGPAPVSLEQYLLQCRLQSVSRLRVTQEQLSRVFSSLVLSDEMLARLGPATCSGQAILLSGPTGSGKTAIARLLGQLVRDHGGSIYVPYAISVENQIISVFDARIHQSLPDQTPGEIAGIDRRWRRVRRPVIEHRGGLDDQKLCYQSGGENGLTAAPLQLKANGGVLILDDFNSHTPPTRATVDRWILSLEDRVDRWSIPSGRTVDVPFEMLAVLTTSHKAAHFTESPLVRRIRHKVEIGPPTESQFREMFRRCCEERNIRYDDWIVSRLLATQYNSQNLPKASDSRDLLDVVEAICRFRGIQAHLSESLIAEAFQECVGNGRAVA